MLTKHTNYNIPARSQYFYWITDIASNSFNNDVCGTIIIYTDTYN